MAAVTTTATTATATTTTTDAGRARHGIVPRMTPVLLHACAPRVTSLLAAAGFEPARLRVSAAARAYFAVRRGGIGFRAAPAAGARPFLLLQPGPDRFTLEAFAGWSPDDTLPPPRDAFDFPGADGAEFERPGFAFPFFTLRDAQGTPLNAGRLEGDGWLLVPAGATPAGAADASLAQGMAALLQARLACERLTGDGWADATEALARRIADDVSLWLLPYLAARAQRKPM